MAGVPLRSDAHPRIVASLRQFIATMLKQRRRDLAEELTYAGIQIPDVPDLEIFFVASSIFDGAGVLSCSS
jgi:hypothetical protein